MDTANMCVQGQIKRLAYLKSAPDVRDLHRADWADHLRDCPDCRAWWDAIAAAGTVVQHKGKNKR